MLEFTIGDNAYRLDKMDARRQFHVARRLAGVFKVSSEAFEKIKEADTAKKGDNAAAIIAAINGFFDSLSAQDDATLDYIIDACLDTVSRKAGNGWAAVRSNGATMYDLTLFETGYIVYKVIDYNIAGFFDSLPDSLKTMLKATAAEVAAVAAKAEDSGN